MNKILKFGLIGLISIVGIFTVINFNSCTNAIAQNMSSPEEAPKEIIKVENNASPLPLNSVSFNYTFTQASVTDWEYVPYPYGHSIAPKWDIDLFDDSLGTIDHITVTLQSTVSNGGAVSAENYSLSYPADFYLVKAPRALQEKPKMVSSAWLNNNAAETASQSLLWPGGTDFASVDVHNGANPPWTGPDSAWFYFDLANTTPVSANIYAPSTLIAAKKSSHGGATTWPLLNLEQKLYAHVKQVTQDPFPLYDYNAVQPITINVTITYWYN